jgi:hypothetical protein
MNGILCEDIEGPNRRCIPIHDRVPSCDPRCGEHRQPTGYVDAAEWAEYMQQTHAQRRCPGCGLWTIWEPNQPGKGQR